MMLNDALTTENFVHWLTCLYRKMIKERWEAQDDFLSVLLKNITLCNNTTKYLCSLIFQHCLSHVEPISHRRPWQPFLFAIRHARQTGTHGEEMYRATHAASSALQNEESQRFSSVHQGNPGIPIFPFTPDSTRWVSTWNLSRHILYSLALTHKDPRQNCTARARQVIRHTSNRLTTHEEAPPTLQFNFRAIYTEVFISGLH